MVEEVAVAVADLPRRRHHLEPEAAVVALHHFDGAAAGAELGVARQLALRLGVRVGRVAAAARAAAAERAVVDVGGGGAPGVARVLGGVAGVVGGARRGGEGSDGGGEDNEDGSFCLVDSYAGMLERLEAGDVFNATSTEGFHIPPRAGAGVSAAAKAFVVSAMRAHPS